MATEVDKIIGRQIALMRNRQSVEQQQLADMVSLPLKTLMDYETGETRIPSSHVVEIATALGVNVSEFFPQILPTDQSSIDTNALRMSVMSRVAVCTNAAKLTVLLSILNN